jgi:hypothetical protein
MLRKERGVRAWKFTDVGEAPGRRNGRQQNKINVRRGQICEGNPLAIPVTKECAIFVVLCLQSRWWLVVAAIGRVGAGVGWCRGGAGARCHVKVTVFAF